MPDFIDVIERKDRELRAMTELARDVLVNYKVLLIAAEAPQVEWNRFYDLKVKYTVLTGHDPEK